MRIIFLERCVTLRSMEQLQDSDSGRTCRTVQTSASAAIRILQPGHLIVLELLEMTAGRVRNERLGEHGTRDGSVETAAA